MLKKFAHSRNLLTEFARSIEKLLTMKNLSGSDGSTRWLNVSYQANRSTACAHHSTVSVVTAGTCWGGPSSFQEGPATHLRLVSIACRSYETKPDFAGPPSTWYRCTPTRGTFPDYRCPRYQYQYQYPECSMKYDASTVLLASRVLTVEVHGVIKAAY